MANSKTKRLVSTSIQYKEFRTWFNKKIDGYALYEDTEIDVWSDNMNHVFYFKKSIKQDKSVYFSYLKELIHLFIVDYLQLDLDNLEIEFIDYAFDK